MNTTSSNKRIAKNTLLLYIRLLITMLVGLITSRIVLQTLGVEDYGIYNVVGGVVVVFSFISGSMAASSQRFITCALGRGDSKYLNVVFSTCVLIFVLIAVLIVLLSETIGLWFLATKMQIPAERMEAAMWVYQFSILATLAGIMRIPYNAVIIAYERMSIFAYLSILEAVLNLSMVLLLTFLSLDKLILYSILIAAVQIVICFCYYIYCKIHLKDVTFKFVLDGNLFKEMFGFSGWVMTGSFAVICYTQGLNILLNMFFGPAVNAARGVAVQVQTVVRSFCANFQTAVNPQITKSYVQSDMIHLYELIVLSSKFSFFLILTLSLPIMLETTFVLKCWLGIIPEHTETFIRLILLTSMIVTLSNPLIIALQATGKIRKFQILESSVLLCIPVFSYVLLKFTDTPPEIVFVVHFCFELLAQYVRVKIILPYIKMKNVDYLVKIIYPILWVLCISPVMPLLICILQDDGIVSFITTSIASLLSSILTIYFLGCTKNEKYMIRKSLYTIATRMKRK